ncbi:MAG: hypothetical protein ABIO70_12730 [Pseudomonadota bacterium]
MVLARQQKVDGRASRRVSPGWTALVCVALSLASPSPAGAACPATLEDLAAALDASVEAFRAMDAESFEAGKAAVKQVITCPSGVVEPAVARQVHLIMALDAYLSQNPDQARAAFRAVRFTDPGYGLPLEIAPRGNLMRELFEGSTGGPEAATVALASPSHGEFYVDGRPATRRPTERPFVLQWVDEGRVRWSDHLPAGAHLPMSLLASLQDEDPMAVFKAGVAAPSQPALAVPPPVAPPERGVKPGVVLLGAGGVSAVGALGLGVAALAGRHGWQQALDDCVIGEACEGDPQAAMADLDERAGRVRALGYASQGAAGLALGLGLAGGVTLLW